MTKRQGARRTIHSAISDVLRHAARPLMVREIYDGIIERDLYSFGAQDPENIVKQQVRRHTKGLDFPTAAAMKYFQIAADGKHYTLLERPERVAPNVVRVASKRGPDRVVTVPRDDEADDGGKAGVEGPTHSEMQWRLLDLGVKMGLSVWAPRADRGRSWEGRTIGSVPRMLSRLPFPQWDKLTTRTIENIDVIWLERNAIIAGFEVEHSTAIYSGLLRMADLVTLQPNLDIRIFIVGAEERFPKFAREVARPTFHFLRKPLHSICKFLAYGTLVDRLDRARESGLMEHLKPSLLDSLAEPFSQEL
jgi:hypothetical protein